MIEVDKMAGFVWIYCLFGEMERLRENSVDSGLTQGSRADLHLKSGFI